MNMDSPGVCLLQTLLVLMILRAGYAVVPCPRPCSCPQPTELHCTFRSLTIIPRAVNKHVERMNLGFNSINKITENSLAGLKKLELLMIHANEIDSLSHQVFRDLVSLQMLKLSFNKLTEINRNTFLGLWSLSRLHLDHNQLEFIHPNAFQGLTSLRLLQLEGNRLQQLHPATFSTFTLMGHFHISTLRHLYLSDNGLQSLPSSLVATMPHLENLYLHGNPWICDCKMRWFQHWNKTSPGVLKCKKDKALPGGQLCPMCFSPRHLQKKELLAVESLICSSPVISSPHKTYKAGEIGSEVMTKEAFREPFGNISLGLSDEHGNEVDLKCSIGEPREITNVSWEQVNQFQLVSNITFSVDLDCPVDREKYEQLWRLIAYYSNVPAHLQRGIMFSEEPHLTYVYRQDSKKDALYYTGVKAWITAQPAWLMQTTADLQLNRLQSSAKMVKLILSVDFSETIETELLQRQKMTWVIIKSTNTANNVLSAISGSPCQMNCNVESSGQPVIHWAMPDGSKLEAPHSSKDNRVSVSSDGRLVIKSVSHTDTGRYYCTAKVHSDLDVLPIYLTVQESSSPPPWVNESITSIEQFAGNPIYLPCMVTGSPDADINWILPNSNIVNFRSNSSRAFVYSNGTLHIPQIGLMDSGYYKCIATNQYGVDTLATKVIVVKKKGLRKPLRKFPVRPQSASGVNTQIQVSTEDIEETSGDSESAINDLDPLKRRIQLGVAPGRRRIHPLRNIWRRPSVIRKKQTGSLVKDRKDTVLGRKVNMSKSKIDPEKWADILAKIRDRNMQNTVTPLPSQPTTERRLTELTTQSQDTTEGSSDGVSVQEKEGQDYFTTHTEMKTEKHNSQGTHVTSESYITHDIHHMTSNREHTHITPATVEPHTMQHTTHNTNLNVHRTSDNVFFFTQTPSVPIHGVTFWQNNENSASSSSAFSVLENQSKNTDVAGVKTADGSKASERSNIRKELYIVSSSPNDRELSLSSNKSHPAVILNKSEISREGKTEILSETPTTLTGQRYVTLDDLQFQAMLPMTSQTTTLPTATRRTGSEGHSPSRLEQPVSRRRNGGRRNRPSRRKAKLNKPTQLIVTKPLNSLLATVPTSASTQLKIEPLEVTTANCNTPVPFTSSQTASSGSLSHKESTDSRHDSEAATYASSLPAFPPKGSPLPLAKPLSLSTSAAPTFPTASPSFQTSVELSESFYPTEHLDILISATQFMLSGRPLPPVKPLEETQRVTVTGDEVPRPRFPSSSQDLSNGTEMQADVVDSQSEHQYTTNKKMLLKDTGMHFSLPESQTGSAASMIKHENTSNGFITTQRMLFQGDLQTEQFTTKNSSTQNTTTSIPSKIDLHITESASLGLDAIITKSPTTTPPTSTLSSHESVVPFSKASQFILPTSSKVTSKPTRTTISYSQAQQTDTTTTKSEPKRPDYYSLTQSPYYKLTSPASTLTSRQTVKQEATPVPTITAIQTEGLQTTTHTAHKLPEQGSIPRGKPRIYKSNYQTFNVKAKTDARLPCNAEGNPVPFLSWTKVASGESIAQNTRVQRFEVHPNGTLIIRNTQPTDGGQYLCTVQNQYGTDETEVNLVVLTQLPRILEPRNRNITVHLGGKVDLECKLEVQPMTPVTWILPNRIHMAAAPYSFSSQQRVAVLTNGTLRITQATFTDKGAYKCFSSTVAGTDTAIVYLHVSVLPPVIQQIQYENTTLPEGNTAYIHCTATGAPQPVIRWITPGGITLTSSQFVNGHNFIVFPNGTLYIEGLGIENAGRYECSASNGVASSRRTVILSIKRNLFPSKTTIIKSSPQRTDVAYGSILLLNCVATGNPDPRITWRTPSKKLVDAQYSFDPRIKVFPNGSLTIQSVTDKDSGDYLCVARNKMGDDYVLLRVNVLTRPAKIEQKLQQSSQEVVYGGDFKVDCVASGVPNPEISWALPDGTMVNLAKQRDGFSGGRSRRYVVFDNGTLYFNDVGTPEEGDYTCYAMNQLGKDEMKVRVKVKAATSPPHIKNKDQQIIRVSYGGTVTLSCDAKGEPMPVTTWISPTKRVISHALDKYQLLDDGTLLVQKVQRFDGGNYTCLARNRAGQDHKTIMLEVLLTPPTINGLRETLSAIKVTAVEDQQKLVDCVAKGIPTPRIMWVLPGNMIVPAPYYSNRVTVHQNGTLEFQSLKRSDSGQLACIARNEGGEVRLVVNLDVKEVSKKPPTRVHKTDLPLTVGKVMTLNCSLDNIPVSHVTWVLPNGTPLLSGARSSKFFHQSDGSLIINNPTIGDSGTYRCMGRDLGGLVEHSVTLYPGRKPEISNRYNSPVNVMNGETLLLHCLTNSKSLRLTWTLPKGVVLNRPQRAGRYSVLQNGTLVVQQVSVYDQGSYICQASNEYGSSLHAVSVIVITYPPRITNALPSVSHAKRGVAIQLNCVATGVPKADIAWETPDKTHLVVSAQPRLFGNKYLNPQGSLIIQNPTQRDIGTYRCTARNAIGVDSKTTFLNVF